MTLRDQARECKHEWATFTRSKAQCIKCGERILWSDAILRVRNEVIEECAKVADEYVGREDEQFGHETANYIRALKGVKS